ncbi:MAG TPA: hypothetical protein VMJ33_04250, partial [Gallionella sp.]|nr:hypothetical protein [Gallionella sp.]
MDYQTHPAGFRPIRLDRLRLQTVKDSYKAKGKLSEPAVCEDCGAVFLAGRWQWVAKPKDAHKTICPACHRMRDHFPAGYVNVAGEFFAKHE